MARPTSKNKLSRKKAKASTSGAPGQDMRWQITAICEWFDANARDLSWRRRRHGYAALVSEAMLQQTQVSRVVERFQQFMQRFPTVQDLAAADLQQVLALWQGLGYYRRARNLHAAARKIVEQFNGRVPQQAALLRQLPGVGRYTAGAIASIVFEQPEPIVDGNVARVLARWFARRGTGDRQHQERWAWQMAGELIAQADRPGTFNEAMMELGATVCTPRSPACDRCPAARWCQAFQRDETDRIPAPGKSSQIAIVHHHAVIYQRGRRVLLHQRSLEGMWAELWQVPTVESPGPLVAELIQLQLPPGLRGPLTHVGQFAFATTHRRVQFHVFRGSTRSRAGRWVPPEQLAHHPMSSPQQRIVREYAMAAP